MAARFLCLISLLSLLSLGACQQAVSSKQNNGKTLISPLDSNLRFLGRVIRKSEGSVQMIWSATEMQFAFQGRAASLDIHTKIPSHGKPFSPQCLYRIEVDGQEKVVGVNAGNQSLMIAENLLEGSHQVRITKLGEAETSLTTVKSLHLEGKLLPLPAPPTRRIEFYGNSITCGFGNLGTDQDCPFSPSTENAWQSYAAIASRAVQAEHITICYSGRGMVQNYDRSREGTLPDLFDKIDPDNPSLMWSFSSWIPQLVVINLGTNDFAHENPDQESFVETYTHFVQSLHLYYPEARFVLLSGPMMNDGNGRRSLSRIKEDLILIRQKLADDSGIEVGLFHLTTQGPLGYGCAWHPNLAQHALNGGELGDFLRKFMNWE
ncbi:MAG: GDSL-type esterase/lipase family protein [Bacteroidota bacterium]